ncbi:hypothetical protein AAHH86_00125 [Candidatus Hodgkinia cicadicola]
MAIATSPTCQKLVSASGFVSCGWNQTKWKQPSETSLALALVLVLVLVLVYGFWFWVLGFAQLVKKTGFVF